LHISHLPQTFTISVFDCAKTIKDAQANKIESIKYFVLMIYDFP